LSFSKKLIALANHLVRDKDFRIIELHTGEATLKVNEDKKANTELLLKISVGSAGLSTFKLEFRAKARICNHLTRFRWNTEISYKHMEDIMSWIDASILFFSKVAITEEL